MAEENKALDGLRRIKLLPRQPKGSFHRLVNANKAEIPNKPTKIRLVRAEAKAVVADEPSKMSETEERMADLLEAAQETKPIADKVAEMEMAEGKTAEAPNEVWEGSLAKTEQELPLEMPRKKRRGRRGKRG